MSLFSKSYVVECFKVDKYDYLFKMFYDVVHIKVKEIL